MKHVDKLKHLGVFTAVHFALLAGATYALKLPLGWAFVAANLGLAIAAFVTEDAQRNQEGRVKDGWDAFADMVASVPSTATFLLVQPYIKL